MEIGAVGDDFDDDWFGARHLPAMWNGHRVEVSSTIPDYRSHATLVMMKAPSEVRIEGTYNEQQGLGGRVEFSWRNDPGPPPRERESSREKESTNNEKDSSSSERTKDDD